jgi:D-alanine-D-alanine ligase
MIGTVVGVLRGGPSREHDVSLKTGHAILSNLREEHFTPRDIYIDREGRWHVHGRETTPSRALESVDVVIVGLHGEYGEDGEVQKILERHGVPYTGSDSFSSHLAMHKVLAKEKVAELGIKTPRYRYVEDMQTGEQMLAEVVRTFPQPVVVKPVRWGSSVGISIVSGYAPLHRAVERLLSEGAGGVLIEELIVGREATAGVVEDLRGEPLYALPTVEIIPPEKDFFSYDAKYSGATREICPGNFSPEETDELQHMARAVHQALGLRHYSRSDFIISPKGIYFLEANTLPGLTEQSLLPKSLSAIGVHFEDFLEHLVTLARR